ncbi:TetR/AcrR family transcriptional regulator [Galactobacter caseinivorans]|uniref:TetR/AcrR family transcriptional regulator n=1 Tax=Galactobacter caseinivorans TaxID=2676123 RepID=UPI001313EC1D|nr:TetR/AcrR family transcriptional regulator [Galactobacter caseinivorans]
MNLTTPSSDAAGEQPDDAADGRDVRWADHRQQRRAELIRAARKSIHRCGPAVPMDQIAAEAGTSKSVLYRYFGGKEGLRTAIGNDVVLGVRRAVVSAGHKASGPVDTLQAMIRAYLAQAAASPHTYAFVLGPAEGNAQEQVRALTDELVILMTEHLQALLAATNRVPAPELLSLWPTAALGLIRAAGDRWVADPTSSPSADALAGTLTEWLLSGIAAPLITGSATDSGSTPTTKQLSSIA